MGRNWYVIHTLTGHEDRVKRSLELAAKEGPGKDLIFQVLVPTEKISEVKGGKKKISSRKFFPGYVLVEMDLTDEAWFLVKNLPGVSGFIGSGVRPLPLTEGEIKQILKQTEEKKEKPTPKVIFEKGEGVKIIEGPFTNFTGTINEVSPDKGKLKVMVSIFGRAAPMEVEYWQVERL